MHPNLNKKKKVLAYDDFMEKNFTEDEYTLLKAISALKVLPKGHRAKPAGARPIEARLGAMERVTF